MTYNIRGKYAVVTGGSHGIGRSIALSLAEEGCNVAICARNIKRVNEVVKEIKAKGVESFGISADVLIASDIQNVMKKVTDNCDTTCSYHVYRLATPILLSPASKLKTPSPNAIDVMIAAIQME